MTRDEHLRAISTAQANNSIHTRNALVSLWIMGCHAKQLMADMATPAEIAAEAGITKRQLYAALDVHDTYKTVRDIPA